VHYEQLDSIWKMDGAREIIKSLNGTDSEFWIDRVRQAISAPSCSLTYVRYGNTIQNRRGSMASSEEKACLIASMIKDKVHFLVPLLMELLSKVLHNVQKTTADGETLADLLDLLLEPSMSLDSVIVQTLVDHGKRFLLGSSGSSADDIRPLFYLMEQHPGLFTNEDRQIAEAFLKETIDVIYSNRSYIGSDTLIEEASAFKSMAVQLGIEIPYEIQYIEEYANEQEDKMANAGPDVTHFDGHVDQEEWCSDDTIASLFSAIARQ
jgi:hypothetical protein